MASELTPTAIAKALKSHSTSPLRKVGHLFINFTPEGLWCSDGYVLVPISRVLPLLDKFEIPCVPAVFDVGKELSPATRQLPDLAALLAHFHREEKMLVKPVTYFDSPCFVLRPAAEDTLVVFQQGDKTFGVPLQYIDLIAGPDWLNLFLSDKVLFSCSTRHPESQMVGVYVVGKKTHSTKRADGTWFDYVLGDIQYGVIMPVRLPGLTDEAD